MASLRDFIYERLANEECCDLLAHSSVVCSAETGNRVLYVSDEFECHTGYAAHEAIGRNLSFLQGPGTEPESVEAFRTLMREGRSGTIRITNYRKDGTPFLHECEFRPVRDAKGAVTHFIAVQHLV